MTIKLAVNYSGATADLLRGGHVDFGYFKTPAWPDLIATAEALRPVDVHFPLLAGYGIDGALDGESRQSPDWGKIEALLAQTGTPLVNVHMVAPPTAYPGVPLDTGDPAHSDLITERLIADVSAVVRRFGAERVIAENNPPNADECLRPAYQPEVISRVVRDDRLRPAARPGARPACSGRARPGCAPVCRCAARRTHPQDSRHRRPAGEGARWLDRMRQQESRRRR